MPRRERFSGRAAREPKEINHSINTRLITSVKFDNITSSFLPPRRKSRVHRRRTCPTHIHTGRHTHTYTYFLTNGPNAPRTYGLTKISAICQQHELTALRRLAMVQELQESKHVSSSRGIVCTRIHTTAPSRRFPARRLFIRRCARARPRTLREKSARK